jgi:hypothetical protein
MIEKEILKEIKSELEVAVSAMVLVDIAGETCLLDEGFSKVAERYRGYIEAIDAELETEDIDNQMEANRLFTILSRNTELSPREIQEIVKTEMEVR